MSPFAVHTKTFACGSGAGSDTDDPACAVLWYADVDGDGFGDPQNRLTSCSASVPGFVRNSEDCDDTTVVVAPNAAEICDLADNNCNGVADSEDATTDPLGQVVHYLDADQDGFGDDETATGFCPGTEPDGWILLSGDCNDAIDSVLPGGVELCDSLDNDCDGEVDEAAVGVVDYFVDADGDGYGGPDIQPACSEEPGLALIGGDCDDADPFSYPGAPEICGDAVRQDCTALSVDDCDSDGHADIAAGGDDCDDARADVHPGANEVCDGVDNNCTGLIDDDDPAVDLSTVDDWYTDSDGDGYGSTTLYLADACAPIPGAAVNFSDCDDTNPDSYPGAIELCDGVDNTCDGIVDEQPVADPPTYYIDADGDGFGNPALSSTLDCDPPGANWVLDSSDCQDGFDAVNPLAVEICDGLDNNCDGLIDDAPSGSWTRMAMAMETMA